MTNAYSFFDLARYFPNDLLLAGEGAQLSYSFDLLREAAARVMMLGSSPACDFVPYAVDTSPLSRDAVDRLRRLLSMNDDALRIATMAGEHGDFAISAFPAYGKGRIAGIAAAMLPAVSELQDLMCARSRLFYQEGATENAIASILDLLKLSDMLCAGGGDMDTYLLGIQGRIRSLWNIHALLLAGRYDRKSLHKLRGFLLRGTRADEGFVQSSLSDFIRDVVFTFAANGDAFSGPDEIVQWLHCPLMFELARRGSGAFAEVDAAVDYDARIRAIAAALSQHGRPFDAVETTRELAARYVSFRDAFADCVDARVCDAWGVPAVASEWPREFQLTHNAAAAASWHLILQTAKLLTNRANPLGRLIIHDIASVADLLVEHQLIHVWRYRLGIEAAILMIDACDYQLRFGVRARSVGELQSAAVVDYEPRDPLTLRALQISRDGATIIGPPLHQIRRRIPLPDDIPDLHWSIPGRLKTV